MHPILVKLRDRVVELKTNNVYADTVKVILKEMLQDYVLAAIYSNKSSNDMIFIGGSALRKLYKLNRFSEDLDFSVFEKVDYHLLGESVVNYFHKQNFDLIDYAVQESKLVSRLTLKFAILKELGLSQLEGEKLHVKIETTLGGNKISSIPIAKNLSGIPLVIKSYPLEILMAGKINACLNRVFKKGETNIVVKGRDYFDLIWYMENKIVPDLTALREINHFITLAEVFAQLDAKVAQINPEHILIDLKSYFENKEYITTWCHNFHASYKKSRGYYEGLQH